MKPEFEKIINLPTKSFMVKIVDAENRPKLSQAWHYHPEIEICYTLRSKGRRFVGNNISHYKEHDMVMFGSNLPHGFISDKHCSQIVIQMEPNFLGNSFINSPELHFVKKMFSYAKRGLEFHNSTKNKASKVIQKMLRVVGLNQLIHLLELLSILSQAENVEAICSEEYALDFNEEQLSRIKILYNHIIENFDKEIHIKQISEKLYLSEASFYKFVKKQTKKTYSQIINEFRIGHASKLLINSDKNISQICFESGYNNISYFDRKFKEIMLLTPQEFKNHYANQQ